jgi:hypothetical protein
MGDMAVRGRATRLPLRSRMKAVIFSVPLSDRVDTLGVGVRGPFLGVFCGCKTNLGQTTIDEAAQFVQGIGEQRAD